MPQETSSGSPEPTPLPDPAEKFNLEKFRTTKDSQALVAWVREQHTRSSQARTTKVLQWRENLFFFFGHQYIERLRASTESGLRDTFLTPQRIQGRERITVNRTRSFVRTEMSKFLTSIPQAVAVPATAEDQDVRAAYAAEQAWLSISELRKHRQFFTKAAWWMCLSGNGFVKQWWDPNCLYDPTNPEDRGDIKFGALTPFNLFVPDLREQEIEDQPYIEIVYKKPVEWCYYYYGDALKGVDIKASTSSANSILEEGYLNLAAGQSVPDSVLVYEAWIKPGATKLMPEGGVVILIDETLVAVYREGLPYTHHQYPVTKYEHIPSGTFYADSPLVDTNGLQREYNQWRSRLNDYVKKMSAPQILAQKGAVVPQKWTNEAGVIVEYKPGYPPPTPLQLTPLPQHVMDQQQVILQDIEDITGQHQVSKGTAPPGVTAGTAISYLQEKDDAYNMVAYQSIEDGHEKTASQTIALFVQYVDLKRKIKVVGADGAFDTIMLQGSDVANGTDIRVQRGSAVGESQAAKEAKVMDMFSMGLIDQPTALKLLEVGGAQKVLDTLNVAEKKAQRENTKMKSLTPEIMAQHQQAWGESLALEGDPTLGNPSGVVPEGELAGPPQPEPTPPPVVQVDNFDIHEVHIDVHDRFRMGQEYESLAPEVKAQFEAHVNMHKQLLMQAQMMQFLQMIPSDGSDGADFGDNSVTVDDGMGGDAEQGGPPGANMADSGAAPAPDLSEVPGG